MDKKELNNLYAAALATKNFSDHQKFIKVLLSSNDQAVIDYHFSLLKNRENQKLYLRLRAAFAKRGTPAGDYLVSLIQRERDPDLLGDALHLLGTMHRPEALPVARKLIGAANSELRDKACYVLGWVGTDEDVQRLGDCLLRDPDPKLRSDAATAHDQLRMRVPQSKDRLLTNLRIALNQEQDEEVLAWIIITIQYFLGKKFGLKEIIDEGTHTGDVLQARRKAQDALMKLNV
jgi:HEAT repeat protein